MTRHLTKFILLLLLLWIAKQASGMLWNTAETYRMGWYQPSVAVVPMSDMSRAEMQH
jgi:hypothetical protein